jgi:hypothetical protein
MRSGNVAVIVADFKVCVERPKMAGYRLMQNALAPRISYDAIDGTRPVSAVRFSAKRPFTARKQGRLPLPGRA